MVRPGTQSAPAVLLMAATITVLGIGTAHAASPANQCESAKNKIAGKYAFCREQAEAKAIRTGAAADYTKCDAAFGQKWAKAEAKGAGLCPTNGDQAALQNLI